MPWCRNPRQARHRRECAQRCAHGRKRDHRKVTNGWANQVASKMAWRRQSGDGPGRHLPPNLAGTADNTRVAQRADLRVAATRCPEMQRVLGAFTAFSLPLHYPFVEKRATVAPRFPGPAHFATSSSASLRPGNKRQTGARLVSTNSFLPLLRTFRRETIAESACGRHPCESFATCVQRAAQVYRVSSAPWCSRIEVCRTGAISRQLDPGRWIHAGRRSLLDKL